MITTATFEGGIPETYDELCRSFLPRPIHDSVALENTLEVIDRIVGLPLNPEQEDYLALLSDLVYKYEQENVPPPAKISGVKMLETVLQETGTKQVALTQVLGVSESLVSLILKGERPITVEHAKKLAEHFGVEAPVFLDL
jgi:HTH-type transcriptional regulator/antitoxin HigA